MNTFYISIIVRYNIKAINELIEKPTVVYFLEIDLLLKEKPILKKTLDSR